MNASGSYKKFLMNRVTITQPVTNHVLNLLVTEDEVAKNSFHKIMIHHWTDTAEKLFEVLADCFGAIFLPVNCETQNVITTFYTSSLPFVLKVIKADFMFPHSRNMLNLDILFNDKTSTNLFCDKVTLDDIVANVVSSRFDENCELNLSNLCNDPGFLQRKIYFYDITLLSNFKNLMIRMGRDTKILNLSNNNLSQIPLNILNFFIKGELIGVNLSNNNIPSISELQRISSKIEKLWVEGNPLCEDMEPMTYLKQILQKFPRLTELDGLKLNENGITIPFFKTFLVSPDKKTKMVVEKFISLYFSHYDSIRRKIGMFYDEMALMTLSTSFADSEGSEACAMHSRNMLHPVKRELILNDRRWYSKRAAVVSVLTQLPDTVHDLTTFKIDVLKHDNKCLIVVIDGVFKEKESNETTEKLFQFRRTFVFGIHTEHIMSFYYIVHEMYTISLISPEWIEISFKNPIRNLNKLSLINPGIEEKEVICTAFMYYTQLKKSEAEARLAHDDWDLRGALKAFSTDFKNDKINPDKFINNVFTMLEDEID